MKKFMKFSFVTAVVLILAGLVIAIAAVVAGGGKELAGMIQNGDLTINSDDFIRFGKNFDLEFDGLEPLYEIDDVEIFNEDKDILTDDIPLMEIPSDNIEKLNINLGGGEFFIMNSSDNKFLIAAENAEKLQVYAEDGELYLKALRNGINNDKTKIYLYIPEADYEKADIFLGAGTLMLENKFRADDVNVAVGAGEMIVENIICKDLDVNVGAGEFVGKSVSVFDDTKLKAGAGHIEINGTAGENLDIRCSMGGIELSLDNDETDFNYEIACVAGSVEIGARKFAALSGEKKIDNQASGEIDIDCSMGSVTLDFN